MSFETYIPLCDALVLLMKPLVEIAIHDLDSGLICYINGEISARKIGDASLLDVDALRLTSCVDKIIYPKINFDGRLIRSISIPVQEKWLICINSDVSIFNEMSRLSRLMLAHDVEKQPESLFKNDWQERLHQAIFTKVNDSGWQFDRLTNADKKIIIHHLYVSGAFNEKNAADYIADTIGMGRATIFKYLKEWRTL